MASVNIKPNKINAILFSSLGSILFIALGVPLLSGLAVGLSLFIFYQFIEHLGGSIPISQLIIVLASMQWLIGPILAYAGWSNHIKYYMYVPEEEYMPFAIGGIISLMAGMSLFKNKKEQFVHSKIIPAIKEHLQNDPNISLKLIGIGFVSSILQGYMPGSLGFIFYLLSNVMYVGVIYMLFQRTKLKWWGVSGAILFMFVSSMQSTMFHGLLLWLAFFSFYYTLINRVSFTRKIGIVVGGIVLIYVFQIVKWEVRDGFRNGGAFSTFFTIIDNRFINSPVQTPVLADQPASGTESFVIRLNQGWIISRIMYYIPNEEPYVGGATVWDAITSTLLPRFLSPNKTTVGGAVYFERFTGMVLEEDTSMGASLLGEGYANFGELGAFVFLFLYGIFISFMLSKLYGLTTKYPTLILWLPLLFLQVVKAESDLLRVLNHLVKASILVWGLYWFLGKILKWKI